NRPGRNQIAASNRSMLARRNTRLASADLRLCPQLGGGLDEHRPTTEDRVVRIGSRPRRVQIGTIGSSGMLGERNSDGRSLPFPTSESGSSRETASRAIRSTERGRLPQRRPRAEAEYETSRTSAEGQRE